MNVELDGWGVFGVACFMLAFFLLGLIAARLLFAGEFQAVVHHRPVEVVEQLVEPDLMKETNMLVEVIMANLTAPFDYAGDALNKKIAEMVLEDSHPYMGDITTRAWGGGWDSMDSTCEGRKYLYYVSHNRSFVGFGGEC